MIGVQQNEFTTSLDDYKQRVLTEIQKMTIDLSYVVDKQLENDEEKNKILDKIKAVSGQGAQKSKEAPVKNDQIDEGAREKNKEDGKGSKGSVDKNEAPVQSPEMGAVPSADAEEKPIGSNNER